VREFANRQPQGIRIGVVAFSGGATLLTPPTTDRVQVQAAVNYLTLGRGTNVGDGLQVALETIAAPGFDPTSEDETARRTFLAPANPEESIIVLLSDGASTVGPSPLDVAHDLARAGIRTYTVGIGTTQGDAGFAGGGFGGGSARQLNEVMLKAIADETGGKYYTARNASQLHEVYGQIATHHELVEKRTELTFLAVGAAFAFTLAGGVLGTLWFARLP
jgi:Ca-activated chloride channel family protein